MPPILPQMRGDSVSANRRNDFCGTNRIGMIAAACVTDGGDMVDVDAETEAMGQDVRLPGLVTGMAASSAGISSSA